jgi:hypothetical protein
MEKVDLPKFKYNGARSMVLLHEKHLTDFLKTWREAKKLGISLPKTEDPDYLNLETLLFHVFRSARGYMMWICEKLILPDPEITNPPEVSIIEENAQNYLLHLCEKWRFPLIEVEEEKFHSPPFKSRWGVEYCIDAMLEHAVIHPIRHEFQIRNLIINHSKIN